MQHRSPNAQGPQRLASGGASGAASSGGSLPSSPEAAESEPKSSPGPVSSLTVASFPPELEPLASRSPEPELLPLPLSASPGPAGVSSGLLAAPPHAPALATATANPNANALETNR